MTASGVTVAEPPPDRDERIRRILSETKTIAVVGASPKPHRPSYRVMEFLQAKGYRIIPVNPGQAGGTILGETVYATLAEVPAPIDMVDIFRHASAAGGVTDEAVSLARDKGIKTVWMQLGVRDDAAAARAEAAGLSVIMDRCPKIDYPRLIGSGIPGP